jgi:hypothetical protein
MSFTGDVLKGLAQYLEDGGVGTYEPTGAYPVSADAPIFLGDMPGTPDRVIVLSAYVIDDDPSLPDSAVGVQARTRGAAGSPGSVDDLDDAVFDRLHGARGITAGTVRITQILRRSGTPLGRDGNRRFERSSNFYVTAARPSLHRT